MVKMYKKVIYILLFILCFSFTLVFVQADDIQKEEQEKDTNINNKQIQEEISKEFDFENYVSSINEHIEEMGIEDIDFSDLATSLISSNSVEYKNIIPKLFSFFTREIKSSLKGSFVIYFIVLIMVIISNLELEKSSDIIKIAHLACFASLATITIKTFIDVITMFKSVVLTLTTLMQIVSPFLMAILISTGAISTTGIIQPMVLFIASAVGFIVTYVVIPFFSISVAMNVICTISENLKLNKMSKLFSTSAIWIVGVLLTFFLGILSMETNITSSVDSLAVKTTQAAVSNFVPVVGKFFSDSFESVVGASKIIGNVGGTLGIISVIIVAIVPVIKIAIIMRYIFYTSFFNRANM